MARSEPSVWDGVLRWSRRQATRRLDRFLVGVVVFGVAYVIAGGVVDEPAKPTAGQSALYQLVRLAIAVGFVLVAAVIYTFTVAPYEQRNTLRTFLTNANDEIARRDRIEYAITADEPEVVGGRTDRAGRRYTNRTVLMATLHNESGPPCQFSAEVTLDIETVGRIGASTPTSYWAPIAWETTFEYDTIEVGHHTRKRLWIAECWQTPKAFWFMVPEIQAWNRGSYGRGLAFEPNENVVRFQLEVINHSGQQSTLKRGTVAFADDGSIESFELADVL